MNVFLDREMARADAGEKRRSAAARRRGRSPRWAWSERIVRVGQRFRTTRPEPGPGVDAEVRIRYAGAADAETLARLAALDEAKVPTAPVLLVEVDGEAWVARSLVSEQVIANPFRPTAVLSEVLAVRAAQLRVASGTLDQRLVPRRAAPAA